MLKITDNVDLKELEKYGYQKYENEDALIDYFKKENSYYKLVFKDRTVHAQFPIGFATKYVNLDNLFEEEIKADLVEKVSDDNE